MTYESHILLVEDCPSYARLITAVLAQIREPNHLTRATSGERAIELLSDRERFSRRNPDLILLDVNLPGQDGFEVLSCIKSSAIYRTIPVVMLSATADELVVRIVSGWSERFDAKRAAELGFTAETSFDEIVRTHIDDELGGKIAN